MKECWDDELCYEGYELCFCNKCQNSSVWKMVGMLCCVEDIKDAVLNVGEHERCVFEEKD